MKKIVFVVTFLYSSFAFSEWLPSSLYCRVSSEASCEGIVDLSEPYRVTFYHACYDDGTYYSCDIWRSDEDICPGGVWDQSTMSCREPSPSDCANTSVVDGSSGYIIDSCFSPVTEENYSDCSTESGAACYSTPDDLQDNANADDYICGTLNGVPICVSSITSDGVGTSSQSPGTIVETLPPTTSTQTASGSGSETTTTITSETTTTTTTETTPLTGGPESVADGAGIDPGAGNIAPAVCENGQYASTLNACDTTTVCPQTHYVDAGVCLPLPTQSVVSETTETTTTTTVVNNTTGQEEVVVSQGTTQQTLPPQNAPQQKIELDVQFEFSGPCDPSMTNYYECMDLESTMPAHTVTDNADYDGAAISAYERINNAPIVQSFSALGSIIPSGSGSCPVVSIDLADTLINRVITTSIHCDAVQSVAPAISAIMIVVWLVLAAFLFGRA